MAYNSKEEFMGAVQRVVGERDDDEALSFMDEMSDTYDSMTNNQGEDWEQRYKDNDAEWRKRYRERFLSKPEIEEDFEEVAENKITTFEDLFESEG